MINKELIGFIEDQTKKGATKEIVSKELLGAGWTNQDIEEAFNAINIVSPKPAPTPVATPTVSSASIINPTINPMGSQTPPEIKNQFQSQYQSQNPVTSPKVDLTQQQNFSQNQNSFIPYTKNITPEVMIKEKGSSGSKTFLIVLILFLLAGGVLGYFFKDKLMNYFVTKDNVQPETPVVAENPVINEIPIAGGVVQPEIPATSQNPVQQEVPVVNQNLINNQNKFITLTKPLDQDKWIGNNKYTVSWTSGIGKVEIFACGTLFTNTGLNPKRCISIVKNQSASGSYLYNLPYSKDSTSSDIEIKVTDASGYYDSRIVNVTHSSLLSTLGEQG